MDLIENRPMKSALKTPVIGIAGWKKSGKTTLTVRLIEEFTRRGLKVASIKHAHHEFQVDDQETDSARHRRAGAGEVVVVGGKRWAMMHELKDEPEPNLDEIFTWLSPSDLVIVEGYKTANIPKIEARRSTQQDRRFLAPKDPTIIAIASDHETDHGTLPLFSLDDIGGIADFITRAVGVGLKASQPERTAARPQS
jgi:molybdopterin-guanine dinucleotide biosynthesis adapter protein